MTLSPFDVANVRFILAGHGDWFSAQLLRLIAKSDRTNLAKLRLAFPEHVEAYETWCNTREDGEDGSNV